MRDPDYHNDRFLPGERRTPARLVRGLLFVMGLLATLIVVPPLMHTRSEALRSHLSDDVLALNDALSATENDLLELQASVRGYVLTRQPTFRAQYRDAQASLAANLAEVARLAPRASPLLHDDVAALTAGAARWQEEFGAAQIALVEQGRADLAAEVVASDPGQARFAGVRSQVQELRARNQQARAEALAAINRWRLAQGLLTSGLAALALLAGGFIIHGYRQIGALMDDLRSERRRLQAIVDHSPEGIIMVEGGATHRLLVNPAAVALLGPLPPQADLHAYLAERPFYQPGGERRAVTTLPLIRALAEGQAPDPEELIVEQADGQRTPLLMTCVVLRDAAGAACGAMAVIQDLRRLREVERLKADFVALVSHELRTPLTAIRGSAQMLLERDGSVAREQALLQIIVEQGERLQELIDNLLNLSQVERGTFPLHREAVSVEPFIQRVLRQQRIVLGGVRVQTDLDANLPHVFVDPRRIEQVLLNLLDNARTFSPPGGLITLRARPAGDEVLFTVADQGPGIPPDERERVFERFYQIERQGTRHTGGAGLGLTICRALVEAHGGRIWIEEAPGGGAAVCLALPTVPATAQPELAPPAGALVRRRPDALDVLVVDDDPALRRLLERGLTEAGYRVETVADSHAALDAVMHRPPDLILLDLMLPGMDGFTLCQRLREWTGVPIVILTVRAAEKDIVTGLQLGADDYVTKPFRLNELLARIEALLRRAQVEATSDGPSCVQVGGLSVDLARRQVSIDGRRLSLTPTEYRMLAVLARHAGQVLTHEQILQAVWGPEYRQENHYLWVHMAHLRQKIEPDSKHPRYLLTERGVGYRLAREPGAPPDPRAGAGEVEAKAQDV